MFSVFPSATAPCSQTLNTCQFNRLFGKSILALSLSDISRGYTCRYVLRALCDHPRNLTDEQIKAIADKGGAIGVNFAPSFIDPIKATVQRIVDHIDHIANLVSADHAGSGSDFDGIRSTPQRLEDATCMPNITKELVDRGYWARAVTKGLGENHLRVSEQVIGQQSASLRILVTCGASFP
jgi:hypothetical protein